MHPTTNQPDGATAQAAPVPPVVVVGYDETVSAQRALRWAASEVAGAGGTLRIVVAWEHEDAGGWAQALGRSGPRWATAAAERAAGVVREQHPGIRVEPTASEGDGAHVLLAQSHAADLLVVGTRGHVGPVGAMLGSVSRRLLRQAAVPVVLLGPDAFDLAEVRIVITSRHGRVEGPAAEWAVRRSVVRRLPIHLLDSWHVRDMGPTFSLTQAHAAGLAEAQLQHEQAMAELRAAVGGQVPVTGDLVEGRGVDVEYARTHRGDLLVVAWDDEDHRPSVRYSHCPVVVVPSSVHTSMPVPTGAQQV